MAKISIFVPDNNAYRSWTIPPTMSTTDLLLLNILIEQKIIAGYAQLSAPDPKDDQGTVRNDLVNVP